MSAKDSEGQSCIASRGPLGLLVPDPISHLLAQLGHCGNEFAWLDRLLEPSIDAFASHGDARFVR